MCLIFYIFITLDNLHAIRLNFSDIIMLLLNI